MLNIDRFLMFYMITKDASISTALLAKFGQSKDLLDINPEVKMYSSLRSNINLY